MEISSLIIAICGTVAAIVFGYIAFSRNKTKDTSKTSEQTGTILSDLGYIKANTEEIKAEQKEQRKINMEVYSRMASVEASTRQAHKRLDEFMGRAKDD